MKDYPIFLMLFVLRKCDTMYYLIVRVKTTLSTVYTTMSLPF